MSEIVAYRHVSSEEIARRIDEVTDVFIDAMAKTPPYCMELPWQDYRDSIAREVRRDGAVSFVAEVGDAIAGVDLYNIYDDPLDFIKREDSIISMDSIFPFLLKMHQADMLIAIESRMFTSPRFQRRGIARNLRRFALNSLIMEDDKEFLVITGHLDSNHSIIKISSHLDFQHAVHVDSPIDGFPGYDYYWKYL